ncbi:sodium-coupled neutral amino acid transporter 5-like [Anoplophora glabripennis]|uniref:sodium-coupled neutral amino acid transporter 5-like n=1 Tax=Anoplophora glabripennis TaxID=217634 RepID=UPI0008757062|nr:sodium-coupled neutral amino acid transporter 5-like [Anoplophora glabripennis]
MHITERTLLLNHPSETNAANGLSLCFAIVCIVDVFGVFPIVTLPKAIIDCGYYGILLVIIVCSSQIYTAILLGKCWLIAEEIDPAMSNRNRYPYLALAQITYGKCLSNIVTFLLDLTIFGGGIPNLIVASRTLELLGLRITDHNFDIPYCYWMIILGAALCPILWLGSPKDMKCVCSLSVFMVISVFILVTGCLLFSTNSNRTATGTDQNLEDIIPKEIPLWKSMLTGYGIIAFQFDIHPTILTIQMDMNDKMKLPRAVIGAFAASLCMCGITTILSSIKYGTNTESSILETLPTTIPLEITAGLTALQLYLTSVVSNNALYQHLEDCLSISRDFNPKRCALRTILLILAVVIAQAVPSFDLVMSTIGGTLIGPLVFILPPLFYLKMLSLQTDHEQELTMESLEPLTNIVYDKDTNSKSLQEYREHPFKKDINLSLKLAQTNSKQLFNKYFVRGVCLLIIIVYSIVTTVTTYLNFKSATLSYSNYTKPCIYNISTALLYL